MLLPIAAMNTMIPTNSCRDSAAPFIVGIDLGTTNCAVAFYETQKAHAPLQLFRIPQTGRHGHEELLPLLPSFLYLNEPEGILVGTWAKIEGSKIPTRLIQSAKSWLSNPAANRKEKILPFESIDPQRRLSPVEASSHLLTHIKDMWNRQHAKGDAQFELEEQEIILTVPASFDEVARALTVEAAVKSGFKHLTLLEEPQAAFYSWLLEHGKSRFSPGETILICDVGGGTTDFTLIDVVSSVNGTELRRMAVGKHLLLGGDNMDAALCHVLERRLGQELDVTQHLSLLHQVRGAKEAFFGDQDNESCSFFLSGKGSRVIGGSMAVELTKREAESLLVEGFFGLYSFDEAIRLIKGSGIRQMGLNYEAEPSITKQLAYFLLKSGRKEKPDYLLFNGGAMKPALFQKRIIDSLNLWYGTQKTVAVLPTSSLDLAVARGAAYFGMLRHRKEAFIGGGIPRTYYLEVSTTLEKKALALLPRGAQEGTRLVSQHLFSLIPNQPVSFQLYHSNTRLHDKEGELVTVEEEELTALPPIQTICKYGKKDQKEPIPVQLEVYLTPIGTLELWLLAKQTDHKWKLEFQLRQEVQEKRMTDETFEAAHLEAARQEIREAFAVGMQTKLNALMASLERLLEQERRQWPPSVLRTLYEAVLLQADKRLLSGLYESRFWNLAGFFLRPGFGYPLDDFRIKELWKIVLADLKKPKGEETELQQWICFRRIAAGLNKGQQMQLFNELLHSKTKKKGYAYAEHLRALASFELVDTTAKHKLGNTLINKITLGKGEPCDYWALGRLGARQLFHGTVANVLPRPACEKWVETLISTSAAQSAHLPFTLAMLARKTNFREIDLASPLLEKVAPLLADSQDLLFQERELTLQEQERFFGDSLPTGLSLKT
jgi:molecular chaperone DnaK (HSP70)